MGRSSSKKRNVRSESERLLPNEGTLTVSFIFGGKQFLRQHQCSASEIKHMKDLCREHGDEAADQLIWKLNVRGSGKFAESVVAEAALDYVRKNWKPPAVMIPSVDHDMQAKDEGN